MSTGSGRSLERGVPEARSQRRRPDDVPETELEAISGEGANLGALLARWMGVRGEDTSRADLTSALSGVG